jgi:lipid-binding SYLF domain-containing protein
MATKTIRWMALALTVSLASTGAWAAKSKAEKKAAIDETAHEVLQELFEKSPKAHDLYEKAFGYAVFSNLKVALGITGGGGSGVAVTKGGTRTYMKMGTGGVGFGLGAQRYHVVFFFEDEKTYTNFTEKGWQADAKAQAAAGTEGANAAANFSNGLAIYQMTDKGLIASADISGTKYWKYKKLNP